MKRRASAADLLKRLERAVARAPNLGEVMRGTLRQRHVRCGKRGCRCRRGKGHGPFLYLSVTVGVGRTVQITVAPEDGATARRYVRNHQRLQELVEVVSEINRELLRGRFMAERPASRKRSAPGRRRKQGRPL